MRFVGLAFAVALLPLSVFAQENPVSDSTPPKVEQQSQPEQPVPPPVSEPMPEKAKPEKQSTPAIASIAVMDFQGLNVSKEDAASLADRFRFELLKTKKFDVMERNEMTLILSEQEFQKTDCVDQTCAIQAGQLIAVKKMVTGSVSKVGGIYSVNVKMLDVSTGRIDMNVAEDCDCPVEKVLTETLKRIACKLAGIEVEDKKTEISIQRGDAALYVKTIPDGASVYLDGRLMDGRTPINLENLVAGKHTVMTKTADMLATKEVVLISNQVVRVSLELKQQTTMLKVTSNPSDAEVYIGRKPGIAVSPDQTTPAIFENLQKDTTTITLFKVGYSDTTLKIPLILNEINAISIQLNEAGVDMIKSQKKMVGHRKQHRAGIYLGAGSLVCAAVGGVMYYIGSRDYDKAEDLKERLLLTSFPDSPEAVAMKKENAEKAAAGDAKTIVSDVLFGIGGAGLAVTLVLYF